MRRLVLVILLFGVFAASLQAQKRLPKRNLDQVEAELAAARDSLRIAESSRDSLMVLLSQGDTIRVLFAKELMNRYGCYPQSSLATMNQRTIDSLSFLGNRVASPEVLPFLMALDSVSYRLRIYQEGVSVLDHDYDSIAVKKVLSEFESIIPQCPTRQQEEFLSLSERVGLYQRAVSRMKRIAIWMQRALKVFRNTEDASVENARGAAEFVFSDREYDYQEYISKIPYLTRLYEAYKKAILEAPLQVGPEEVHLLSYE